MDGDALRRVADLIAARNKIDEGIAALTGRPALAGHLGEWIAAEVFDVDLEGSAVANAIDGRFASGTPAGCTVNIKWYGKREGMLDVTEDPSLDYYLVLTGPRGPAASSRWSTGTATSVVTSLWDAAELFPEGRNLTIPLTLEQRNALAMFSD
jgi:hypothetical protein